MKRSSCGGGCWEMWLRKPHLMQVQIESLNPICNCVAFLAAEYAFVDLTSLKSVRQFAVAFRNRGLPLHLLVNNGMQP